MFGSFRAKASSGIAPTTSWFGSRMPDRVNMLRPGSWGATSNTMLLQAPGNTVANYGKDWMLRTGVTFGGFTTAPDGTTNTARQIVESAGNTEHFITAGYFTAAQYYAPAIRFAAILKSAGRRATLTMGQPYDNTHTEGVNGIRATFDLAGGQIGVAPAVFGVTPQQQTAIGAEMRSLGNGWYLCWVDANLTLGDLGSNSRRFAIYLDNGVGVGAASTTYNGDGASGVYVWKTNVLPVRAWAMNAETFRDDFDSISTVDLGDTRAEGFKWYIHNNFPLFTWITPSNPGNITVSNSKLVLAAPVQDGNQWHSSVITAAYTGPDAGPGSFVGFVQGPPALFEINMKYDGPHLGDHSLGLAPPALWAWTPRTFANTTTDPNSTVTMPIGRELDFNETIDSTSQTTARHHRNGPGTTAGDVNTYGNFNVVANTASSTDGILPWLAAALYGPGPFVEHNGVFYQSIASANQGHEPPNAAWWSVYAPTNQPVQYLMNPGLFHTYSFLILPYIKDDYGVCIMFIDGMCTTHFLTYGPTMPSGFSGTAYGEAFWTGDHSQVSINIFTSDAGPQMQIDWISVIAA
jgi:hypothetical protein